MSNLRALVAVPFALRVAVVLSAAITEEFIYRGFGIEELTSLTGSRAIGGALSWLLFSISHAGLYGLSAALLVPALVGGVLTALYLHSFWVKALAFSYATGVALSRLSAERHFPWDTLVGGATEWLICDYVYDERHNPELDEKQTAAQKILAHMRIGGVMSDSASLLRWAQDVAAPVLVDVGYVGCSRAEKSSEEDYQNQGSESRSALR